MKLIAMTAYLIEYVSNNPRGVYPLKEADWKALEAHGWKVEWIEKPWFKGPLARKSTITVSAFNESMAIGVAELIFDAATGITPGEHSSCGCCGDPHAFYVVGDE
jgi:hypothetical protein